MPAGGVIGKGGRVGGEVVCSRLRRTKTLWNFSRIWKGTNGNEDESEIRDISI